MPVLELTAETPAGLLEKLGQLGYSTSSALSYAKAERSWRTKGTPEYDLWSGVVALLMGVGT